LAPGPGPRAGGLAAPAEVGAPACSDPGAAPPRQAGPLQLMSNRDDQWLAWVAPSPWGVRSCTTSPVERALAGARGDGVVPSVATASAVTGAPVTAPVPPPSTLLTTRPAEGSAPS